LTPLDIRRKLAPGCEWSVRDVPMPEVMGMTNGRTRVLLCDDSRSLATLVEHWLEEHADLDFVGAIQHREECLDAVRATRPDVVLLDTMGEPFDDSTLAVIRTASPRTKVVMYSGYVALLGEEALPRADAFLDKGADHEELVAAIRSVSDAS
jgi:DNA-binding NarL/FixJ family response regulator